MICVTVDDVQARMDRELTQEERATCAVLLDDAQAMIDAAAPGVAQGLRKIVACRMVIRAIGAGGSGGFAIPVGASQGSMSALGYSQTWTMPGGSTGELYLGKADRQLLGLSNSIGSYSPVQELVPKPKTPDAETG